MTSQDTPRRTVTAVASRWEHGWTLTIDGLGVTQSHTLDDAEVMVRDYTALTLDIPPDSFDVEVTVDGDSRIAAAAERTARISAGLNERLADQ